MKPRLLDLFCGAGGCSMGYHRAGFDVVGVDVNPQKNYPFEFHQADAMTYPLDGFDVIHASPPCQAYSKATPEADKSKHPDLVRPVREALKKAGKPWVIENVPGSPLVNPIVLCGIMFDLKVFRHRWFQSSVLITASSHIPHGDRRIGDGYYSVCGNSGGWTRWGKGMVKKGNKQECSEAMGIDWMTRKELTQAIPPAYCHFIGKQLMEFCA